MTNSAPTSDDVEWDVHESSPGEWNNGTFPIYTSDFTFNDVEDNAAGVFGPAAICIVSLPDLQYGALFLNGVAVQAGAQIPTSAFENGELYVQMVDRAADYNITFQFQVIDSGGAASATQTYAVDVHAINDAPVAPALTLAPIAEDSGVRLITQAELLANATDVDSTGLTVVNLQKTAGGGTLVYNGNGIWTYTPAANDSTSATFSYKVTDGTSTTTTSATLDITPVNDAPQNTVPAVQAIAEDAALTFTTLAVSDVDGDALAVTLTAQNGALTLSRTTGLSFGAGDGTADATMTFTGTTAAINAALNGMKFVPTANYSGDASIQIQASDGTLSDTDTIAFTVNAVADAPVITVASSAITPTPEGAAFQVAAPGLGSVPTAVGLADGGFVEVWNGVSGQRFDASGNKIGGEFLLNTYTPDQQQNAQVAALKNGGFVATWESNGQDGSAYGIYARIYDAAGNPISTQEFRVNTSTTFNQQQAAIAVLNDGGFIISWSSAHAFDTSGYDIYAQRYSADGSPIGGETRVNTVTAGWQTETSVAALKSGGYVVTWTDSMAGPSTTKAQIFAADGTRVGSEFAVDAASSGGNSGQDHSDVAGLAGGGFVVTWQSFNRDGSYGGIAAQMFDATGVKVGTAFHVNTQTIGYQEWPDVLGLKDGGFLIAWSGGANGAPQGVFVQRYDARGVAVGGEIQLNTSGSFPQLTQLQSGAVVATWDGDHIYARMLDVTQPTAIEDQPFTLPVTVSLADTNGTLNEVLNQLRIHGLPAGFTLAVGEREGGNPSGDWIIDRSSPAESALLDGLAAHTAQLIVTPAANYNGSFSLDLTATSQEPSNGSTASVTTLVPIMIAPVNDAPVLTGDLSAQVAEGGTYVVTGADLGFTDPDDGPADVTFTVSDLVNGEVRVSGAVAASFTGAQLAAGLVSFVHNGSDSQFASFHVSVEDGNEDHSAPAARTFKFTVTPVDDPGVNDAPISKDFQWAVVEGSADWNDGHFLFMGTDFFFLDAEDGFATATAFVRFVSLPDPQYATLYKKVDADIVAVTAGETFSYNDVDYGSGNVFLALTDHAQDYSLSFQFQVLDSQGKPSVDTYTYTLDIDAVNDPPTATPVTMGSVQEDSGPRLITQGELLQGAWHGGDGPSLSALNLQIQSGHGTLVDNGNGSWTYTPAANDDIGVTFSYQVSDGIDALPNTATMDILPLNDAPVTNPGGGSGNEDAGAIAVTLSGTDIDGSIALFHIASAIAHGRVYRDAALQHEITAQEIANGADVSASGNTATIYFVPDANFSGTVTFTYIAKDDQGLYASNIATATIDVAAVNDAPVTVVPADQSVDAGSSLVFGAMNGNAITISDVDAGTQDLHVQLSVAHGTLTLGTTTGLLVVGNGTGHVDLTGDLSELNAALDGLVYQGDAGFFGGDALVIDTDDLGHTGGGAQTDHDSIGITVGRVNKAPTALTPAAHYSAIDHIAFDLKNTGLSVSDLDASGIETITLSVGSGRIDADAGDSGVTIDAGNGTSSLVVSGTIAALNAFLGAGGTSTLTFVFDGVAPPTSTTLTLTINDNDAAGAKSGSASTTIDIVDGPVIAFDDQASIAEDTAVTLDVLGNDTGPQGGLSVAAINGTHIAVGDSIAVDEGRVTLNADGTLTFTPGANFNGETTFTYQATTGLHYQFFDGDFSTVANIPVTGGTEGFASEFDLTTLAQNLTGDTDHFGIRYTGSIFIVTGGTYTFFTTSDDGSALYIDGVQVVNNDFFQPATERSGSVGLTAGRHAIEIRYFEGIGYEQLGVAVSGPDTSDVKTALFDTKLIAPSTATVDVVVNAVDDAPVMDLARSLQATEQVPVSVGATVADVELDALNGGSGLYTGATFKLVRAGGANAQDTFAFDTTGAQFTVEGSDLKSGGATFATFSLGNGTLTINFTSDETAATSALVNDVLRHIAYTNTSDAPPASVTLAYSFDDGNTGAQGSGNHMTRVSVATVNIGAIDDSSMLTDDSAMATEGTPVTIDVLANDSDPDSVLAVSAINGTHVAVGGSVAVANGSVTLNADGTLTFTPTAGFHSDTSFTYQTEAGLHYQFFDREDTSSFSTVAAIPTSGGISGVASDFDVTTLAQTLSGNTDFFGVRYTGMIHVASGGDYTFYTASDDGSALYVDGVLVVNNDGGHGVEEHSGSVTLTAGTHAIEIRYFEGGGGEELYVNVAGPDTTNNKTALFDSTLLAPTSATVTVSVAPVNNTPEFENIHDAVDAIEQTPVLLNGFLTITDADLDPLNGGAGLYTGASLTLARQGGADADDTYAFDTSGALFGVSGNALQTGGATFATFSTNGGTLTINFTSSDTAATSALVNDVLRHIVYTDTSDAPPADVILEYTFNDGSPGNGQGGGVSGTVIATTDVEIAPVNDAPALTIAAAASYTENGAPVTLDPTLSITDPDGGSGYSATVRIISGYADGDSMSGVGHFDAATQTFTTSLAPNATLAALQAVLRDLAFSSSSDNPGDLRKLEWTISDGSGANATATTTTVINVDSVDDAPSVPGPVILTPIAEDATRLIAQAELLAGVTDPDGPVTAIKLAVATGAGTLTDNHDGTWTYTPAANDDTQVSFIYQITDGIAAPVTNSATLDLTPVNDAPVNTVPRTLDIDANTPTAIAGLSITDVDAGSGAMTTTLSVTNGTLAIGAVAGTVVTGSGTASVTLTGTLTQINATLSAANNVVYTGTHDFFGNDTLTVVTNDNGNNGVGSALTDTDQATIHLNTHLPGTPGDDGFTALPGNERIDALGGTDTVTFNFKLTDATVTYAGNQVIIDGPSGSHTVLTGFEKYVFTDGTVNNNDGDPLVDDLFYYSHNHDVWNAHVDADAHYHSFGWREGRDPDAFFSTSTYQSLNPAAKGVDPLLQFDQTGWKQGYDPSILFDVKAYLAANPDVKAAGIDPLAHFLQNGGSELRQPIAPVTLVAANGFDYVYYLTHNPDVAASHVDPFLHFETVGWKEGRNPNAYFDTKGYLAHYADVAAAGINPLDHYNQSGWKEGRDPSPSFDTTDYLSHYPDVVNAHVNPLTHFLQSGLSEGRSPFADGVWG